MLISIALVSHNSKRYLELLLPSLIKSLKGIHSEILLVDNCSIDSTVYYIETHFPYVNVHKNRKPRGYGANQNKNIARAAGKYIALMNPDMIVPPQAFHSLLNFMKAHDEAGIATCNICNPDGTCQYLNKREPAVFDLLARRFLPGFLQPICRNRLDYYEMRDMGYDSVVEVPFISGSFMFARTDLIKAVKGFDERFFMYFEDVDLCRRLREKAISLLYCPDVAIIHRWERAAHKSLKWTFVFSMSGLKYYKKWGLKLF